MRTAREKILIQGTIDWVSLAHVHSDVLQENRTVPSSEVQQKTLDTIRSLVADGLFELGELSGEGGRFVAWNTPLDESMKRIYDLYVKHFDNNSLWIWECWLNLTDKGEQVAQPLLDESNEDSLG
jgi:hypothetical protein